MSRLSGTVIAALVSCAASFGSVLPALAAGSLVIASVHPGDECHWQEAAVVRSIHAVCTSQRGREFPASHMTGDSWIDGTYEGDVARCEPGSRLKVAIGAVVQSDQGLAGDYKISQTLTCGANEILRHFRDGMVKCSTAERSAPAHLRRYGTGDFFFSFHTKICLARMSRAEHAETAADPSGLSPDGSAGGISGY
jgi:hypothetical protein